MNAISKPLGNKITQDDLTCRNYLLIITIIMNIAPKTTMYLKWNYRMFPRVTVFWVDK